MSKIAQLFDVLAVRCILQSITEFLAENDNGVESLDGKVNATFDVAHVRQLYPEGFVHRCEV